MSNLVRFRVVFSDESFNEIRVDVVDLCNELMISNTTLLRLAVEHCIGIQTFGKLLAKSKNNKSISCLVREEDLEPLPNKNIEKAKLLRLTIDGYRNGLIKRELLKNLIPHM